MNTPMITVIMSVYNGEKYLSSSIESILNQTYQNFIFIIVNDGSTDASLEIIKTYQRIHSKIKIINNEKNIGLTKSLNLAIKEVHSKYLARQDSDDISDKRRLEIQFKYLETHPEIKLLGTRYLEIDETGKNIGSQKLQFISDSNEIKKKILRYNPFAHSSVMIRSDVLINMNGYNEKFKYAQDYELWLRVVKEFNALNLDNVLLLRRYTQNIISSKYLDKQRFFVIRAKLKYLNQFNLYDYYYLLKDITRILVFQFQKIIKVKDV